MFLLSLLKKFAKRILSKKSKSTGFPGAAHEGLVWMDDGGYLFIFTGGKWQRLSEEVEKYQDMIRTLHADNRRIREERDSALARCSITQEANGLLVDRLEAESAELFKYRGMYDTDKSKTLTDIRQKTRSRDIDALTDKYNVRFCEISGKGGFIVAYVPPEFMDQSIVQSIHTALKDNLPGYKLLVCSSTVKIEELSDKELNKLGLARILRQDYPKELTHDTTDDE